jgi:asparagine synthase (glutamine-hydrolysing)
MCGIAGIIGKSIEKSLLPDMIKIMEHRGPDSKKFFFSDEIQLGHCRLAINDLSDRANQPFIDEINKIAVAVNGEIYNYQDVKGPLLKKGYNFQSNSDCEIILHAYIDRGLDFIPELNGMFAISIWDGRNKNLFLIRDRLGIKPLYYSILENAFIFASELKALALCNEVDMTLDIQSFAEYLSYENYFSNRTLNREIKLVEPAEIVEFSFHKKTIKRSFFWQPELIDTSYPLNGSIYAQYLKTIEASVDRHLISDVPLGCYLSAGIDSSSVTYWASKKLNGNLKTYTGHFGLTGYYDEATDAEKNSKILGCDNHRVAIRPIDFINNIEKILWHLDEPRVGMGSFPQYMVAQYAARDVKVILTGHGGDELFAGYPVFKAIYGKQHFLQLLLNSSFRELMFALYFCFLPMIKKELGYFLPNIYSLNSFRNLLQPDYYRMFMQHTDIFSEPERLKQKYDDEYERLTLTYLKYYLPALFIVEDKISMAFSLESRTPLCDNEMLEFGLSLPLSKKLIGCELKHIPRTSMRGRLPDFIFDLPKRGFPTPLRYWFKNELKEYIREFILDGIGETDIFNRKEAEKFIRNYQNAKISTPYDEILSHKIWIILNLIIYFRNQKKRYRTSS